MEYKLNPERVKQFASGDAVCYFQNRVNEGLLKQILKSAFPGNDCLTHYRLNTYYYRNETGDWCFTYNSDNVKGKEVYSPEDFIGSTTMPVIELNHSQFGDLIDELKSMQEDPRELSYCMKQYLGIELSLKPSEFDPKILDTLTTKLNDDFDLPYKVTGYIKHNYRQVALLCSHEGNFIEPLLVCIDTIILGTSLSYLPSNHYQVIQPISKP